MSISKKARGILATLLVSTRLVGAGYMAEPYKYR